MDSKPPQHCCYIKHLKLKTDAFIEVEVDEDKTFQLYKDVLLVIYCDPVLTYFEFSKFYGPQVL